MSRRPLHRSPSRDSRETEGDPMQRRNMLNTCPRLRPRGYDDAETREHSKDGKRDSKANTRKESPGVAAASASRGDPFRTPSPVRIPMEDCPSVKLIYGRDSEDSASSDDDDDDEDVDSTSKLDLTIPSNWKKVDRRAKKELVDLKKLAFEDYKKMMNQSLRQQSQKDKVKFEKEQQERSHRFDRLKKVTNFVNTPLRCNGSRNKRDHEIDGITFVRYPLEPIERPVFTGTYEPEKLRNPFGPNGIPKALQCPATQRAILKNRREVRTVRESTDPFYRSMLMYATPAAYNKSRQEEMKKRLAGMIDDDQNSRHNSIESDSLRNTPPSTEPLLKKQRLSFDEDNNSISYNKNNKRSSDSGKQGSQNKLIKKDNRTSIDSHKEGCKGYSTHRRCSIDTNTVSINDGNELRKGSSTNKRTSESETKKGSIITADSNELRKGNSTNRRMQELEIKKGSTTNRANTDTTKGSSTNRRSTRHESHSCSGIKDDRTSTKRNEPVSCSSIKDSKGSSTKRNSNVKEESYAPSMTLKVKGSVTRRNSSNVKEESFSPNIKNKGSLTKRNSQVKDEIDTTTKKGSNTNRRTTQVKVENIKEVKKDTKPKDSTQRRRK